MPEVFDRCGQGCDKQLAKPNPVSRRNRNIFLVELKLNAKVCSGAEFLPQGRREPIVAPLIGKVSAHSEVWCCGLQCRLPVRTQSALSPSCRIIEQADVSVAYPATEGVCEAVAGNVNHYASCGYPPCDAFLCAVTVGLVVLRDYLLPDVARQLAYRIRMQVLMPECLHSTLYQAQ